MIERRRIVLTGGPGGGKTTAIDLFRRELKEQVAVVPEAATLLFSGGFPRTLDSAAVQITQKAIYQLQLSLEDVIARENPGKVLICDRGTLDSAAYWPGLAQDFYQLMGTSFQQETARYDHVIFFQSAAAGGHDIHSGNPVRNESLQEAALIDQRVYEIWSKHPSFYFVANNRSFISKVMGGLQILMDIVGKA